MDEMVLTVQKWLNTTYGANAKFTNVFPGGVAEDGYTGTQVEKALVTALQIECGLSSVDGIFGKGTASAFSTMTPRTAASASNPPTNKEYILQGGFWCKGYNPGNWTGIFYTDTQTAVEQFQADAGLSTQDGNVTAMIMKALLNTDPYKLDTVNGDSRIRQIQQDLNNRYNAYTGLQPTNGIYMAATNKALIYALQCEEGLSTSVANGNFGTSTTNLCPTLSKGSKGNFVIILQYALYCNGFDPGTFDGAYGSGVASVVTSFQQFMCLSATGVADMSTIKSTMTSNGYTGRSASACDCATILDSDKAATLVNNGYHYVGRYLTGTANGVSKALTRGEVQIILNAGLKLFAIYESHGTSNDYFTSAQGYHDAYAAIAACERLGIPVDAMIYFAVDYDAMDYQITSNVMPYFEAIYSYFKAYSSNKYHVGVYGDRNIANRVCKAEYAESSYVADMSTGYSGNLGFRMPTNWAYDQFATVTIGSGNGQIEIDKDAYSGRNIGVNYVTASQNVTVEDVSAPTFLSDSISSDPIDTSVGAHLIEMPMLTLHGAIDLSFKLSYHSSQLALGTMGKGWHHNYELAIVPMSGSYYVFWSPSVYSVFSLNSASGNYKCADLGKQNDILTVNTDKTFTLNRNNDIIYTFTTGGVLSTITNRTGMKISLVTNADGTVSVTEPVSGKTFTIHYADTGLVASVSDSASRTVSFGYDSNACLNAVTDANGKTTSFTYDEAGHVLTGTDADDNCFFTDIYDDSGRVASQKDGVSGNLTTTFSYDDTSASGKRIVTITDRNGNTGAKTFDSSNYELLSVTDANGGQKTYAYDANGNLSSETNELSDVVASVYDAYNHLLQQTDETGAVTKYTYDDRGNNLSVTYPDGGTETHTYDSSNRVTSITDQRGTKTTFSYDSNGLLVEKDYGDRKFKYAYQSGLLLTSTDPEGGIVTYSCDDAGQVITKKDPDGYITQYTYDKSGNKLTETDSLGNVSSWSYSSRNLKLSETDRNGNKTSYQYNANMKMTAKTDPLGNVTLYTYDGEDRLISTKDPLGNVSSIAYDKVGHVLSKTDENGKTTSFTYDAHGNMLTATKPTGGVTYYSYFKNGKVKTVTDPAGNVTTYGYDAAWRQNSITNAAGKMFSRIFNTAGDLLSSSDPIGNTNSFTYNAYGDRITQTDPNGNIATLAYDGNGILRSKTDPLANITSYSYDKRGNLTGTIDANSHSVTTAYDGNSRAISQTDALGNTVNTTYDPNGNMLTQTDAYGNTIVTRTYDARNLPIQSTDALGNTTQNSYDALGRLVKVIDPLGEITTFAYDGTGHMISSTNALNGTCQAAYDADGNKVSETNPLGGIMTTAYDSSNRKISETTVSGGTVAYSYNSLNLIATRTNARQQVTSYTYDDAGRISSLVTPEETRSFEYDANGNTLTKTSKAGSIHKVYDALNRVTQVTDVNGNLMKFAYDAVGNLTSLTYPDGKTVAYGYDTNNRMGRVTDWANRVTAYQYDENGRLVKTTLPDGSTTAQAYDAAGRLATAVDLTADSTNIGNFALTYDANGQITKENSITSTTVNSSMAYDVTRQLLSKAEKDADNNSVGNYAFQYDGNGNIVSATSAQQTVAMAFDKLNRLTAYNQNAATFDTDGNLTGAPTGIQPASCSFDSQNRLVAADEASYMYDADDTRISVTQNSVTASLVFDTVSSQLSRLLVKTEASAATFYLYGLGLILHEDANGARFYHFDVRGSTIALTDTSGAVTDRYTYGTYGELLTHMGNSETPFLYDGRDGVQTDESSLYYMRARYYSPSLKRFLNPDPVSGSIQSSTTINAFAFASNDPILQTDPSGNSSEPFAGASIYTSHTTSREVLWTRGPIFANVQQVQSSGLQTTTYGTSGEWFNVSAFGETYKTQATGGGISFTLFKYGVTSISFGTSGLTWKWGIKDKSTTSGGGVTLNLFGNSSIFGYVSTSKKKSRNVSEFTTTTTSANFNAALLVLAAVDPFNGLAGALAGLFSGSGAVPVYGY